MKKVSNWIQEQADSQSVRQASTQAGAARQAGGQSRQTGRQTGGQKQARRLKANAIRARRSVSQADSQAVRQQAGRQANPLCQSALQSDTAQGESVGRRI